MRGKFAERFADNTPCQNGNSYYTFRLGGIWGLILDCGEDKLDDHEEYGWTIGCHRFRMRQTEFIENVIEHAAEEYGAEDVNYRIVICHIPFTKTFKEPFHIETDTYAAWTALLREHVKPQMILNGHLHETAIYQPGSAEDAYGQPCPVVIGNYIVSAKAMTENGVKYRGAGVEFSEDGISVTFTDNLGKETKTIQI